MLSGAGVTYSPAHLDWTTDLRFWMVNPFYMPQLFLQSFLWGFKQGKMHHEQTWPFGKISSCTSGRPGDQMWGTATRNVASVRRKALHSHAVEIKTWAWEGKIMASYQLKYRNHTKCYLGLKQSFQIVLSFLLTTTLQIPSIHVGWRIRGIVVQNPSNISLFKIAP